MSSEEILEAIGGEENASKCESVERVHAMKRALDAATNHKVSLYHVFQYSGFFVDATARLCRMQRGNNP